MTAMDIRNLRRVTYQLVEAEERSKHIRNLISNNVGFREEEEFWLKEQEKLKGGKSFDKKKSTVTLAMKEKMRDNFKLEGNLRRLRTKFTRVIEDLVGKKTKKMRNIRTSVRNGARVMRKRARDKFKKKEEFLVKKYSQKLTFEGMEGLNKEDRKKFEGCRIFKNGYKWMSEEARTPSIVCTGGNELRISDDEMRLLKLGPKFCVMSKLDEENFEVELEQTILKIKWD